MKGTNVPLMQLAVFFEHAFPEQIMIPVHLTNKQVSLILEINVLKTSFKSWG
jgi:hypothetical protein